MSCHAGQYGAFSLCMIEVQRRVIGARAFSYCFIEQRPSRHLRPEGLNELKTTLICPLAFIAFCRGTYPAAEVAAAVY